MKKKGRGKDWRERDKDLKIGKENATGVQKKKTQTKAREHKKVLKTMFTKLPEIKM